MPENELNLLFFTPCQTAVQIFARFRDKSCPIDLVDFFTAAAHGRRKHPTVHGHTDIFL